MIFSENVKLKSLKFRDVKFTNVKSRNVKFRNVWLEMKSLSTWKVDSDKYLRNYRVD